jgi:hypothetical protein
MHAGSYRKILAESIPAMGPWLSRNCYRFVFFISAPAYLISEAEELIARQNVGIRSKQLLAAPRSSPGRTPTTQEKLYNRSPVKLSGEARGES